MVALRFFAFHGGFQPFFIAILGSFRRIAAIRKDLECTPLEGGEKAAPPLANDRYFWARFIRLLTLKGFGSWKESGEADLIDCVTFILMENDLDARFWQFFNQK